MKLVAKGNKIDHSLSAEAFSIRSKKIKHCTFCLALVTSEF